jgi:hypothetical protein
MPAPIRNAGALNLPHGQIFLGTTVWHENFDLILLLSQEYAVSLLIPAVMAKKPFKQAKYALSTCPSRTVYLSSVASVTLA